MSARKQQQYDIITILSFYSHIRMSQASGGQFNRNHNRLRSASVPYCVQSTEPYTRKKRLAKFEDNWGNVQQQLQSSK